MHHSHTIENKNGNGFNDAFCFSQGLPIFPKGAKIKSLGGYSIGIAQLRGPLFSSGGGSSNVEESGCQLRSTTYLCIVPPRKRAPFYKMAIIQMSSFATV